MLSKTNLAEVMAREPDFSDPERTSAFWILNDHDHGHVWVGKFSGRSPWERHPADELLHVLEGEVEITLHTPGGPVVEDMRAGEIAVVPANVWHRQFSEEGVVEWGLTPGRTEHSMDELPPPDRG